MSGSSGRPSTGHDARGRREETLDRIAAYFDGRKVGDRGWEGYRKSSDLRKLARAVEEMVARGLVSPERTVFADLGSADGRVNVLLSYYVRLSIGIEIDPDILAEHDARMEGLLARLHEAGLEPPPANISLFRGSSLEDETFRRVERATGVAFEGIDLFYTYITLHDVFARRILERARPGALYMVYGFHSVLPSYPGMEVVIPDVGAQGIVALFRKV